MAKKTVRTIRVVQKLPKPVPAFIVAAQNCVEQMTVNAATFPAPTPALTLVTGHINTLVSAENSAKNRDAGAVAKRDAAETVVRTDLAGLKGYVEQIANADPTNALTIAKAAGMEIKKSPVRTKSDLAAKHPATGSVSLAAKAVKGGRAHEWQYSTDGGKTWITSPTTLQAKTTITGLTAGSSVMFRHRAVIKTGPEDWGQPISALVT